MISVSDIVYRANKHLQLNSEQKVDGKNFHDLIKYFLLNKHRKVLTILDKPRMWDYLYYALPVFRHLKTGKVILAEYVVESSKYKYRGILDLVIYFPNPSRICLIEWKTSRKVKSKIDCKDYFLQLAAYCQALEETRKIKISSASLCVFYAFQQPSIFRLSKEELNEYFVDFLYHLNTL